MAELRDEIVPLGYWGRDAHIIRYEISRLPGVEYVFRGPQIESDQYIACVGSAHTFGCFAAMPFPRLISSALSIETLNLGLGGVGPRYPVNNPRLLEYVNRARLVIVQVLSGRSQSNSLFQTVGRTMGIHAKDGNEVSAIDFYGWLLAQGPELTKKIVAETRSKYVSTMIETLQAIKPPKILFWFSVRTPDYQESWDSSVARLWGEFPHLVNREMLEPVRALTASYVECISSRGLPQPLFDEHGNPTAFRTSFPRPGEVVCTENRYYPSPEMHQEAAALLVPACREILEGTTRHM